MSRFFHTKRGVAVALLASAPWLTPGPAHAGVTHVPLYTFHGDNSSDEFGESVSGAGDVNGDGYADLIVGARHDDNNGSNSGSARVLSGLDGSELYEFDGDSANDRFGQSVSGAGDVNGDGRADLIVGAWRDDNNGGDSGSARVLSGLDGSELYEFNGDNANDRFGSSVSGAGDVNGDGYADLIVGAYLDDNDGSWSGSARVLSGSDGSELYEFEGDSLGDYFGTSVSGAGDVNGDGYADFIVGAEDGGDNDGGYARVFVSTPDYTDDDDDHVPDDWEQQIIDAAPGDGIDSVDDVLPGDDFDGDGRSNFEEYAFCLDPLSGVEPNQQQTSLANDAGMPALDVTIHLRSDDANLSYTVETCTDLVAGDWTGGALTHTGGTWSSAHAPVTVVSQTEESTGVWSVTLRLPVNDTAGFLRTSAQ